MGKGPGKRKGMCEGHSCEMQVKGDCRDENKLKLRLNKVHSQRA